MQYAPEKLTAILETANRYQRWLQLRHHHSEEPNERLSVQPSHEKDDFQLITTSASEKLQNCGSLEEFSELMNRLIPQLVEEKMAEVEMAVRLLLKAALGPEQKHAWHISFDGHNEYWHINRLRDGVQRVHEAEQGKPQGAAVNALIIDSFTPLRNLELCRVHLPELYSNYVQRLVDAGLALQAGQVERGSHLFNQFLDLDRQMRTSGFSNQDRAVLLSACRRLSPGLNKYLTSSFGLASEN